MPYARFNSHRSRERASKVIVLPVPLYSFERDYKLYEISGEDAAKIATIKGVKITNKMPTANWLPCWKM